MADEQNAADDSELFFEGEREECDELPLSIIEGGSRINQSGGEFISLNDIGMAYRKAKADLFYSPRACKIVLSKFESNLATNLETLQKELHAGKAPSLSGQTWTLVPKEIKDGEPETDLITSDPQHLWESICKHAQKKDKKVEAEFRLMEKLPIDFHVFAALWINKVGHKFEKMLTESARGNRLRRGKSGKLNSLSMGSTVPYLHAYCKWRDDAFVAIEQALAQDKSVVAITADVSSFYHKLDVRFMLDDDFIERIGVELTEDEQGLHEQFIAALHQWALQTPLERGLPVGLTASSIIGNVALFELDQLIEREVVPLYYGRYVDDIILVMENGAGLKSSIDVWDWLIKRMPVALDWVDVKQKKELKYSQDYLKKSKILFSSEKNRTFLLSGSSGQAVLKSIRCVIHARTSEWRSLPDLPNEPDQLESALLSVIQRDGVSADSLRKADKVSVRRAGFALTLRDLEAYSRALPAEAWQTQRKAFLTSFTRHVLVLSTFFDFYNYLARVISLAVSCSDFDYFRNMLDALDGILKQLEQCDCSIKASTPRHDLHSPKILSCFQRNLKVLIREAVTAAFPLRLSKEAKSLWMEYFTEPHSLFDPDTVNKIQSRHCLYLKRDLAYRPLKQYLLPPALSGATRHPIARKEFSNLSATEARVFLKPCIIEACQALARLLKLPNTKKIPSGLLFPVRPMGIHDLYLLIDDPFSDEGREAISSILLAMRGFKPEKGLPIKANKPKAPIEIGYERVNAEILRVAVTSWKTDFKSWIASASQKADPDKHRLDRFNRLLNQVIRCKKTPDYLILPELSIPAHWFLAIAGKLQGKGISLICGIEYLHAPRKTVHNQVWAALSHDALGFPTTMIYRQDKQRPALHEERELQGVGGLVLKPQLKPWKAPPIINHGGFQFAVLVCSELTNIAYRTELRGGVDALFVPEWNQDTETFNSLVESAALDIHAYVIQCNDRQYGDSRIRAPHKDSWKRDIVRVKGGIDDYFVTGEIDIQALRAFQSPHRSPDAPFKPVPDGFEIAHSRKTLPTGNSHE